MVATYNFVSVYSYNDVKSLPELTPCNKWASTQQNLSLGFPAKRGSNQFPELQTLCIKI